MSLMSSLTSSVHGVPMSSAWLSVSCAIVPSFLGWRSLIPYCSLFIFSSDFTVIHPRSSWSVWLAGAYDVFSIYLASLLLVTFILCLYSSNASSMHACVPYSKTDLTQAFVNWSCLMIGRCGILLSMVLVDNAALFAWEALLLRCEIVPSSIFRSKPR